MAKKVVVMNHEAGLGSFKSYTMGFVYSVSLTTLAFILVGAHAFSGNMAVAAIIVLAIGQLIIQAIFFLHLGRESSQRWNVLVFLFMLIVVIILVIGTLWIMHNLNTHYDNRSPSQLNKAILHDEGYKN